MEVHPVWQWQVPPDAYRTELARYAGSFLQVQDDDSIKDLEAALHAASNPRFLRGGTISNDALAGGAFSLLGRGNEDTDSEDDWEAEAPVSLEPVETVNPDAIDAAAILPRLGGSVVKADHLYRGVPACQAMCTQAQARDVLMCFPRNNPCTNVAAVRVKPANDKELAALQPYLVDDVQPDAATGSYFLCAAHKRYIWSVSTAKAALSAMAVFSVAAVSVATLGPLAAAGWGLATSALAVAASPLLSQDVWRTLRGYIRGTLTKRQAELVAAASHAAGGQALVLEHDAARLLGPSDTATRRLMAAYGGSTDTAARNDLVLLHALTPAEAGGYVDPIARAAGMPGAVQALRDMIPSLADVPASLIAACVHLGVNSSNWWRAAVDGHAVLDNLVHAVTGEVVSDADGARRAALALLVNWLEPEQARVTFTPASAAGVTRRALDAAGTVYADVILRGGLLPAAAKLRDRLESMAKAYEQQEKAKGPKTTAHVGPNARVGPVLKAVPAGLRPVELLHAALWGDAAAIPNGVRAAVAQAATSVKESIAARVVEQVPGTSATAVAALVPATLAPSFTAAETAVVALARAVLPPTATVAERAAARARVVDAIQGPLAASLAAHRRLVTSESPADALARLDLPSRLVSNQTASRAVLHNVATAAVALAHAHFVQDATAMVVLVPGTAPPTMPWVPPGVSATQLTASATPERHATLPSMLGRDGMVEAAHLPNHLESVLATVLYPRIVDDKDIATALAHTEPQDAAAVRRAVYELDSLDAVAVQVYTAALALAQVALARLIDDNIRAALKEKRAAATAAPVAATRMDKVAVLEQPASVLAHGDAGRQRQLALYTDMARGYTALPQWIGLLDMDADGYKAALPVLLLHAGHAFADNHAAGAMDLRKTAAFLGLAADDLLDVRRLRSRLVPLLTLLDMQVTPHRGVVELLRYNVLMLLADGEFRDALASRSGVPVANMEPELSALSAEFDAA